MMAGAGGSQNDEKKEANNSEMGKMKKKKGSVWTIFKHADGVDMWLMALGFLGAAADGLTLPIMLVITSKIMNNLGEGSSDRESAFTHNMNKNSLYLVYLALASAVAGFLEGYCWTATGERQAARTRGRYLKAVLRQDIGYLDMQADSTSEVVSSVSNDTIVIQDTISEKVPNLLMNLSSFFGSYVAAFLLSWRLALVALPFIILLIIPGLVYGRMLMSVATKIRLEYNKAGAIAEQAISSVRTVYSFVGESRTMTNFSDALQGGVKYGLRQGLAKGLAVGSNSITFAIWAFLSWYSSRLVMYHGAKGGTIFAVGAAITIGGLSFGSGLANVKYLSDATSAGERIMKVIKRVPAIDSSNMEGQVLERVVGEVEFKGVEFAYPSRPDHLVFKSFSLRVPAGQTVALVGGSGSGKSTAISLLERFYDPAGGAIMLDGVDIRRLQLKWLRSQMGLVSQEPALFATTIKENILFGKEDATMEQVEAAAKAANAHNFITQLPQGYNTQVGERGVQMSGGQKQRIAIARAIIKSPHILLLDEATSALDSESERVVQEALDAASLGRTTLVIAHRLSTIRNAHTIAVVQEGQVMETGSHDDLLRVSDGIYSSLVRFQQNDKSGHNKIGESSTTLVAKTGSSRSYRYSIASRTSSANSFSFDQDQQQHGEGTDRDADGKINEKLPAPSFWRLLRLNAPEWKQACVGCLSAVSFGAVQPIYAYIMGSMIFVYFLEDHNEIKRKIRSYSIFFLSLAIFAFLVNIVQHYNFAVMGEKLTKRVRERMLSKILTFEVAWFDRDDNSTGAVCSQLAKDANVVRSLVGDRMALLVQAVSAVLIACTAGLIIAWRLALVMIAIQPLIIVCFYAKRVLLKSMSKKSMKAQNESSKLAAEAVSNMRTITAFSSQSRILGLFEQAQQVARKESMRQAWYAGAGLGSSQGLMTCTWALDFWYGGRLVARGLISAKQLLQTFMILVSTGRVIADAGSMTTDLAKGADAVATVFAVLDRYTMIEPDDLDGARPDKQLAGQVELRDVHFAYPSRPDVVIFRGFSLEMEAGKSTALVGPSGSGKSTIIGLIERFYDPISGCVKIDGKDIRSYHLKSLRQHIGLVSQEPTLFSGSIRDNIAYGVEEDGKCSDAEVEAAARTANAHDFISGLKDGYETWCGDRGVQLSGGQKQRIAIARAMVKNPRVLLLDEATSALDSQSEKVVQEALERVMVGRTSVVVAHRLSTVRDCDQIAVVEGGRVAEKGNHSALMGKGPKGTYYSLVQLQQITSSSSSATHHHHQAGNTDN